MEGGKGGKGWEGVRDRRKIEMEGIRERRYGKRSKERRMRERDGE